MIQQGKIRRRPTPIAIIVGTLCFLMSLGTVAGIGVLIFQWMKQVNPALGVVLAWGGSLPLVILVGWMTLLLMDMSEKTTGISLRTRSSRKSG